MIPGMHRVRNRGGGPPCENERDPRRPSDRGATVVEYALLVALFTVVVLGGVELGDDRLIAFVLAIEHPHGVEAEPLAADLAQLLLAPHRQLLLQRRGAHARRLPHVALALARVTVLLPTRRACRELAAILTAALVVLEYVTVISPLELEPTLEHGVLTYSSPEAPGGPPLMVLFVTAALLTAALTPRSTARPLTQPAAVGVEGEPAGETALAEGEVSADAALRATYALARQEPARAHQPRRFRLRWLIRSPPVSGLCSLKTVFSSKYPALCPPFSATALELLKSLPIFCPTRQNTHLKPSAG